MRKRRRLHQRFSGSENYIAGLKVISQQLLGGLNESTRPGCIFMYQLVLKTEVRKTQRQVTTNKQLRIASCTVTVPSRTAALTEAAPFFCCTAEKKSNKLHVRLPGKYLPTQSHTICLHLLNLSNGWFVYNNKTIKIKNGSYLCFGFLPWRIFRSFLQATTAEKQIISKWNQKYDLKTAHQRMQRQ